MVTHTMAESNVVTGMTYQLTRAGFSIAFGATSAYLAAAASRLFVGQRDWIKRGVTADGTVLEVKQVDTVQGAVRRKLYAPVVAFTPTAGERSQFTSALSSEDRNRYTVGQMVKVRYLPDDPSAVDLDSLTSMWWPFLALVLAMIVCAAIAALPFILPPPAS
jgi:Protein of unknown function (DUF3592)